jgi:alpha-tubulin suppressor-like RCC1 family protein
MATEKGVWDIQDVRDKQLQSLWEYTGAAGLFTWGMNENGQLGLNEGGNPAPKYSSPVQIPATTWAFVSNENIGDSKFMIASKTDGTLWGWGDNEDGQVGLNSKAVRSSPVQIPGTTWGQQLARTGKRSYAIKTDGTLWSWGYNSSYGALGHNNKTQYSSPKQVPGSTWANVDTMGSACLTTKTDGTMWNWGANSFGMLGIGNDTAYSSPKQVPGTTWNSGKGKLSGGGQHAAAIKTDGTLWMWGVNEYGMLGQNNRTNRNSPVQIPGDTWSKVGCNGKGISAIKTDGTLWVWGSNMDGRLGLNQAETPGALGRSSPTQIPGTTWNSVVGGIHNNMATKTDGTLWMWGPNVMGSLGQNNTVAYSSPVQIPGTWDTGDGKLAHLYFGAAAIANI